MKDGPPQLAFVSLQPQATHAESEIDNKWLENREKIMKIWKNSVKKKADNEGLCMKRALKQTCTYQYFSLRNNRKTEGVKGVTLCFHRGKL